MYIAPENILGLFANKGELTVLKNILFLKIPFFSVPSVLGLIHPKF